MEEPEFKQQKRSKRHRRARHKVSRKQAVECMKEFAIYARGIEEKRKLKYPKTIINGKYF